MRCQKRYSPNRAYESLVVVVVHQLYDDNIRKILSIKGQNRKVVARIKCAFAAWNGYFSMFKEFYIKSKYHRDVHFCRLASMRGHLDIVKYVKEQYDFYMGF